ncbi:MAG: hypothetical protein H7Y32_19720 [Chloroflexales bacterium]|nr:hypothetical protein [Chloroflexales bacterium]
MRILAISRLTTAATPEALNASMEAEVAQGRQFFEQGFIREGYMDPAYTTAYLLLDSPSLEDAQATLARYPDTQAGLNTWDLFPLIGLPAIAQSLAAHARPLPAWWPEVGNTQTDAS